MPVPFFVTALLAKLFPLRIRFSNDKQKTHLLSSLPVAEQVLLKGCDCLLAQQLGRLKGGVFFRYHYSVQAGTTLRVAQVCNLTPTQEVGIAFLF